MFSRRTILKALPLTPIAASVEPGAFTLRSSIADDATDALRALALRRQLLFGAAANTFQLRDGAFAAVLAREAGILVPEYELKRAIVEPVRGKFDFSAGDSLLAFAGRNAMLMRGHPLVWHKRNPAWLEGALLDWRDPGLLTEYIQTVAAHFRGHMHSWDVVNEAIAPDDGRKDCLRESLWLKAFGPTYIDDAYHAARAADPGALLVYNDWGCEAGDAKNDRFRAATLAFLDCALARGVPIQALGLQGHLAAFGPLVDQKKLSRFLEEVRARGLRILVTEHDVDDTGGPSDARARDRAVADASRRFLDVVLANPATIAVLTWGLSDRFLDPPSWRQSLAGYSPRMLPFDPDFNRTPMWHAIASSLEQYS